ncbi:hypothetical protein KSP40_PGU001267 [Platanthera guangdongensis]|uniref:Uncharacterized protein n=1 Tax=Platanthera guangdongensis TaxID=2320717 RepID=A0ABR2LY00_9ASPA
MATFYFSRPSLMDPPLFSVTDTLVADSLAYHRSVSSSCEKRMEGNESEVERLRSCDVYGGYCWSGPNISLPFSELGKGGLARIRAEVSRHCIPPGEAHLAGGLAH